MNAEATVPTLWDSAAAEAATGGRSSRAWMAGGVSIDSRSLQPVDLFIALHGPSFDGHDFVQVAFEKGAAAALVDRMPPGVGAEAPLLRVGDSLAGLTALGRAARARTHARCLGITGSVGKTSSKEMLRAALAGGGKAFASAASHNNHWGVPLSLARLPLDARFGVFEMGMNHAGEIRGLTALVAPEVALVTQIAPAHIGNFADGLKGIAAAKAEIFEGLAAGGTAVINADAPMGDLLKERALRAGARLVTFGESDGDYRLRAVAPLERGSRVEATLPGGPFSFTLGLPGRHMALNALGVLAAAAAVGVEAEAAVDGLASLQPLAGRGARQSIAHPAGGSFVLIDEGYNANPVSVRAALALLRDCPPKRHGRRVAVLGDMLELGDHAPDMHADLVGPVLESGADLLFTCGTDMRALCEAMPDSEACSHHAGSAELAEALVAAVRPDDVVLVKGSLGVRMATVVRALTALSQA